MARKESGRRRGKDATEEPTRVKPGRKRRVVSGPSEGRHGKELVSLAAIGVSVLLGYVLFSADGAGILGEWAQTAMRTTLGRLAPVVPLLFLTFAVALILELRPRPASAMGGGLAALFLSVCILTASGFPPLGAEHGEPLFVREAYQNRAGWLGEVLYGATTKLVGSFGAAILGWLLLLAGISLITGLTLRRVLARTRSVASAVKDGAEETTRKMREGRTQMEGGPLDDPYLNGFGSDGQRSLGILQRSRPWSLLRQPFQLMAMPTRDGDFLTGRRSFQTCMGRIPDRRILARRRSRQKNRSRLLSSSQRETGKRERRELWIMSCLVRTFSARALPEAARMAPPKNR